MKISEIRNLLERRKGQKIEVENTIKNAKDTLRETKRSLRRHERAREIVKIVGLETQRQLQFHISDMASLALEAVFNDPYQLKVDFVERRNKTECDLLFVRDEMEIDPITASGVGAVDVASFALRVASWSMSQPRSQACLILDEPFKHLKGEEENKKVLTMINEISKRLGLQIIMVSDERIPKEDIIESADRVFEVTKRKGKSKVVQYEKEEVN